MSSKDMRMLMESAKPKDIRDKLVKLAFQYEDASKKEHNAYLGRGGDAEGRKNERDMQRYDSRMTAINEQFKSILENDPRDTTPLDDDFTIGHYNLHGVETTNEMLYNFVNFFYEGYEVMYEKFKAKGLSEKDSLLAAEVVVFES